MTFATLAQATSGQWAEKAVHDTVAAIMQHPGYQRTLTDTLWLRLFRWLSALLDSIRDFFRGSQNGRVLVFVLFGALVLLIIARIVIDAKAEGNARIRGGSNRVRAVGGDNWAEAERFAANGNFTMAAHALFAALLGSFAARGEVRLHPSKTTGDYARELRRRDSRSLRGFLSFRSRYDRVIYGTFECTADEYQALLNDARPLLQQERAA